MELLNTWQKLQQEKSISKTLVFLKSLLEIPQPPAPSSLPSLYQQIFETLTLHLISQYQTSDSEATSCLSNLESLIRQSQDAIFHLNFCELYNTLATYFRKQSNTVRALKLLEKGLELSYIVPFPSLIKVFINLNIAGVLSSGSKHSKALKHAIVATELGEEIVELIENGDFAADENEKLQVEETLCIAYHTVGVQHEFLLNLTSALEWYVKAWDRGKVKLSQTNFDLIEKIEHAVNAVKMKFNGKRTVKPRTALSRTRSGNEKFAKTSKNLNFSRTIFSSTGKKAKTFVGGKKINQSFYRSSFSRSSQQSRQSYLSNSNLSHISYQIESPGLKDNHGLNEKMIEEHKISNLDPQTPKDPVLKVPENYFKNVLDGLEQKLLNGNKETIACQTDQSSLTPYLLNRFKEIQSEGFDYSFVEIKDPATEVSLKSAKVEPRVSELHRALVKCGKIDIHFKQYEARYFINSALTVLYLNVSDGKEFYDFVYELNSDDSIMEIIDKTIHSRIDLVNQKLCIVEISSFVLIKGMYVVNDSEIKVTITQKTPRADLSVNFQCVGNNFKGDFQLIDLLKHYQVDFLEPQYVFSCFSLLNDSIALNFPLKPTLDLIYYKHHVLSNGYAYFIKISEVCFQSSKLFLIEGVSSTSPQVLPLLVEPDLICKLSGVTESTLSKNIDKIPSMICVRQSQIQFHQHRAVGKSFERTQTRSAEMSAEEYESLKMIVVKIQSVFRGSQVRKKLRKDEVIFVKKTIENIEFTVQIIDSPINKLLKIRLTSTKTNFTLLFKYPIPFPSPFKDTIPELITFHEKLLVIKNPRSNTAFVFDNSNEFQTEKKLHEINLDSDEVASKGFHEDFYGKIHFRTCVIREKVIRQVSMTLEKSDKGEDLAEFFILSGTAKDAWQRLVIDLKTICEKSGIEKTKLTAIGYYVVRHMMFYGEGNMVCIDFEANIDDFERNLIRVQAAIRGKLLRKRLRIEKKILLVKKKITLNCNVWTIMLMKDVSLFYLNLVKGFVVLRKVLDLSGFSRDGIIQDFDLLMRKVIIPELKIVKMEGKWYIRGIEKYEH